MLKCSTCKKTKPKEEFYERSEYARGYTYSCKSCVMEYERERKRKKREREMAGYSGAERQPSNHVSQHEEQISKADMKKRAIMSAKFTGPSARKSILEALSR